MRHSSPISYLVLFHVTNSELVRYFLHNVVVHVSICLKNRLYHLY